MTFRQICRPLSLRYIRHVLNFKIIRTLMFFLFFFLVYTSHTNSRDVSQTDSILIHYSIALSSHSSSIHVSFGYPLLHIFWTDQQKTITSNSFLLKKKQKIKLNLYHFRFQIFNGILLGSLKKFKRIFIICMFLNRFLTI